MIYRGIYFGCYDTAKSSWTSDTSKLYKLFVASAVTTISSFVIYPMDTVRRRMMMRSGERGMDESKIKAAVIARKIFKYEGIGGFYKGMAANVLRSFGGSVLLVAYDELQAIVIQKY